jgi:hypothetical protein
MAGKGEMDIATDLGKEDGGLKKKRNASNDKQKLRRRKKA